MFEKFFRIYLLFMAHIWQTLFMAFLSMTSIYISMADWVFDLMYNPPDFVLSPMFRPTLLGIGLFGIVFLIIYLFKKSALPQEMDRLIRELIKFSEEQKKEMAGPHNSHLSEAESWEQPSTNYQHQFAARVNHIYQRVKNMGYSSKQLNYYSNHTRIAPKGVDKIVYELKLLSERIKAREKD